MKKSKRTWQNAGGCVSDYSVEVKPTARNELEALREAGKDKISEGLEAGPCGGPFRAKSGSAPGIHSLNDALAVTAAVGAAAATAVDAAAVRWARAVSAAGPE